MRYGGGAEGGCDGGSGSAIRQIRHTPGAPRLVTAPRCGNVPLLKHNMCACVYCT